MLVGICTRAQDEMMGARDQRPENNAELHSPVWFGLCAPGPTTLRWTCRLTLSQLGDLFVSQVRWERASWTHTAAAEEETS